MRVCIDLKLITSTLYQAEGQSVLHVASQNGDENMIRTLYLARANATVTDEEGELKRTSQTRGLLYKML